MQRARLFTILGCITIGILSRFLPHPPNCTAINAVALFGAHTLNNRWLSVGTALTTLFLSDSILGFHSSMPSVYLCVACTAWVGTLQNHQKPALYRLPIASIANSLFFFFMTNFGVWLTTSLYPSTACGLATCYLAGLPFLINQIVGDLMYGLLLHAVLQCDRRLAFHDQNNS